MIRTPSTYYNCGGNDVTSLKTGELKMSFTNKEQLEQTGTVLAVAMTSEDSCTSAANRRAEEVNFCDSKQSVSR